MQVPDSFQFGAHLCAGVDLLEVWRRSSGSGSAALFGAAAWKSRLSRLPARAPSAGDGGAGLSPRTSPRMPSWRISRSTVCFDTPANLVRASHAVLFRRPWSTSGSGPPPVAPVFNVRSRSMIAASLTARLAGGFVLQDR